MTTAPAARGDLGLETEVERIMEDARTKEYRDLRDRAAYMYVTGTHPSHLREFFTRALSLISKFHARPSSLDGRSGNLKLDDRVVTKFGLEQHPMVTKVREFIDKGYRIRTTRGTNERKPFGKIFMEKGHDQVTVQVDGSVKDHWG